MLPADHHPHDARWLRDQLAQIPASMRARVAQKYADRYSDIVSTERASGQPRRMIAAESTARRECNERLRLFIIKLLTQSSCVLTLTHTHKATRASNYSKRRKS